MDRIEKLLSGYSEERIKLWADNFHPDFFNPWRCDDWHMPILESVDAKPDTLYDFRKVKSCIRHDVNKEGKAVHFFSQKEAEKLWNTPEWYLRWLTQFDYVVSPCYHTMNAALPVWWFQTYRNRLMGQYLYRNGINVIPSARWGEEETFAIAFRGLPRNSTIAVSSVGYEGAEWLYQEGIDYLCKNYRPSRFLVLGEDLGADYSNVETICFPDDRVNEEAGQKTWHEQMNSQLYNPWQTDNIGMPTMKKVDKIPTELLGFNRMYAGKKAGRKRTCHFFIEDYQFERVWNDFGTYLPFLKRCDCVITPDFSLYENFPLPVWWFQTYRNRLIGQAWQKNGIEVIPSVNWGGKDTFEIVFAGIPKKSTLAFSTIGWYRGFGKLSKEFQAGIDYMCEKLQPQRFIIYGKEVEADYHGIEAIHFVNDNIAEAKIRYQAIKERGD